MIEDFSGRNLISCGSVPPALLSHSCRPLVTLVSSSREPYRVTRAAKEGRRNERRTERSPFTSRLRLCSLGFPLLATSLAITSHSIPSSPRPRFPLPSVGARMTEWDVMEKMGQRKVKRCTGDALTVPLTRSPSVPLVGYSSRSAHRRFAPLVSLSLSTRRGRSLPPSERAEPGERDPDELGEG